MKLSVNQQVDPAIISEMFENPLLNVNDLPIEWGGL